MNKLGFHLIGKPNEDFESCSDCIHAGDSEEICILRKCIHVIKYLYDCYEKAEQKTGKWIIFPPCIEEICMCSNCRTKFKEAYQHRDTCPSCGARMETNNEN